MRKQFLFLLTLLTLNACGPSDTEPEPEVAPSGLSYSPSSYTVTEGTAGESVAAVVAEGTDPIEFALVQNSESAISINNSTGVISSTDALAAGTYDLNVSITNDAGSQTYSNAFQVIVTSLIAAPSGLTYANGSLTVRKHESASTDAPSLIGTTPLSFEITNSAGLPAEITIDASTGVITAAKGLEHGSYSVDVKASNSAGELTVTGAVTVVSEAVVFTGNVGVQSFIQAKCSPCHVSGGSRADYTVYDDAKNNIDNIISRTNSGSMPKNNPQLSQEEVDLFRQWKADGLNEQ